VAGVPVVGGVTVEEVAEAVRRSGAAAVAVLSCPQMNGAALRQLAWDLGKTGTDLCVAPALLDVAGPLSTGRPDAAPTLVGVSRTQLSGPHPPLKEMFDRCVAALALLVLSPAFIAVMVAIKMSGKGRVLATQTRVGKDGHTFKIYKFRTMVAGAEDRLAEPMPASDLDRELPGLGRDPRVTPIGAILRKYSIDQLPQLINVLKGEMSLVGPRPALPAEAAKYADHIRLRLAVKPGMTGMWQVSGRSNLSWEECVRLDLRYVENWSFALDLAILWKTIAVVLGGRAPTTRTL
jgi:lipopolysaccharide/colanic/teichoic acid biosynthesis glycosyltransferase